MLALIAERAGAPGSKSRRRRQARLRGRGAAATSRRRNVRSQQIVFPNAEAAQRRGRADRQRARRFVDIAKERGKTEKDIDLGTGDQGRHRRPGGRRRRLRAQGRRSQRARAGPLRHRAGAGAQDRARAGSAVRGGGAELKQELHRARQGGDARRLQQDRGCAPGGRRCRRSPPKLKLAARTIEAVDRSGRDPSRRAGAASPTRSGCSACFTTDVGVEQRSAAVPGRLYLVRRRRHYARRASARSTRSRSRSRRAGASRRSPTRLNAKATEILDKLKAGATLADVAAADDLKRAKPRPASSAAGSGALSPRVPSSRLPDRQGRGRQGRGPAAGRTGRVPGDRRRGADPRRWLRRDAKRTLETLNRGLSEDIFGRVHCPARKRDRGDHQSRRAATRWSAAGRIPTELALPCRSSRRPTGIRQALRARRGRRSSGPRWSPTSKRRCRPSSRSPAGAPMSFLLESVEGGAVRGRYSIIGLDPDLVWRAVDGQRRDQPRAARRVATPSALPRGAARGAARADRRKPHRAARRPCRRWRRASSAISATTWCG